jgi:recombination associated protein RdgC
MICAKKQEKVLPAAVINEALEEKVAAIAEKDGRPVHRKERQSLKDDIIMELLPKAFTRSQLQFAYIAPKQNYIVVNAASANKAEELLSALRESIGSLPVTPLTSLRLPYEAMTDWVLNGSLSEQFIIGSECELSDPKESGSVIRCKYQDLASPEITSHIKGGMIVTQLSLNWQDGLEFVLDDKLAIKRMRFADNICEKADSYDSQDAIDQFDNEFSVMTIELSAFIDNLTAALGGINKDIATTD